MSYLTPEHEQFRQIVRRFLINTILPQVDNWEAEQQVPKCAWRKFGKEGFLGINHSRSVGGQEKDIFYSAIFLEELGRMGYAGIRAAIAVHAYMATQYLALSGSRHLQTKFLRPAISGHQVAALAITESHAGSDISRLQTTLHEESDCLVLNGEKRFIVNGPSADFFVVAVKTGKKNILTRVGATGLSVCVVESDRNGLTIIPQPCIGWRSAGISDIRFDNIRIPKSHIVGRVNEGFIQIMRNMQLERLAAGIMAVGDAANCLDLTWEYLKSRRLFDSTISGKQVVRHKMADLLTEVEATRQLAYHAACMFQEAPCAITECSMIKLKATELARTVSETCLHFFGAKGYREGSSIARIMHDAHAATLAAGANEIMRDIIARCGYEEPAQSGQNLQRSAA